MKPIFGCSVFARFAYKTKFGEEKRAPVLVMRLKSDPARSRFGLGNTDEIILLSRDFGSAFCAAS